MALHNISEMYRQSVDTYFRKIDSGTFDHTYFDLFAEDVELYFPKFGFAKGRDGIRAFGAVMSRQLQQLTHDIDNFRYVFAGNKVVVEGTEQGITTKGESWPDHRISFGKFCNVFEFRDGLISRVHIYTDPDFISADTERIAAFRKD